MVCERYETRLSVGTMLDDCTGFRLQLRLVFGCGVGCVYGVSIVLASVLVVADINVDEEESVLYCCVRDGREACALIDSLVRGVRLQALTA